MEKELPKKDEVLQKLHELAKEPGIIYSFSLVLRRDFFYDPAEVADIDWRSKISFQEATFLGGLIVKNPISLALPHPDVVERQIGAIYELFEKLHHAHWTPVLENLVEGAKNAEAPGEPSAEYRKLFGSGDAITEPIFYGGSGAYDFQYLEFSKKRYEKDGKWLQENTGISIEGAGEITMRLKKITQEKVRKAKKPKTFEEMWQTIFDIFCFTRDDLAEFTDEQFYPFINNFSVEPGKVNEGMIVPGDYNQLASRPVVRLEDGRYFMPVGFNLPQSVYESPYYWMVPSENPYRDAALTHQGEAAENIAFEMLATVFGKENVYKNVVVKESRSKHITDIDVLAIAGNKAVIVQVKSKKLTVPSRKGDKAKLEEDFKGAVQDAYDQGLLARKAVVNKDNVLEHEGKKIVLHESINDAYILCLSLDHYPAVLHQLDVYLKKEKADPYPLAMSIFDLDIVTFYLRDPFEFLYYFRQRVALTEYARASNEAVFLAVHLKQKLYKRPDADGEAFDDSFAQLIDANFPAMRGYEPETKAAERLHHKWKNPFFDKLIAKVKEAEEPGFTDAIFFLYDLASGTADEIMKNIERAKIKGRADGQRHDFTMEIGGAKGGISFLYFPNIQPKIQEHIMAHAITRKYKAKADIWIELASIGESAEIVDFVAFNMEPWVEDKGVEEASRVVLKQGIPLSRVKPGKKYGRNEKCYCGSGKKYKKCCAQKDKGTSSISD